MARVTPQLHTHSANGAYGNISGPCRGCIVLRKQLCLRQVHGHDQARLMVMGIAHASRGRERPGSPGGLCLSYPGR